MTDATEQNQPVYSIEKIYVKDLSLEIPNAPQIFLEREAPSVDVQLHHTSSKVDEGVFQTELTLTVTAKIGEKTMFLVEALILFVGAGETTQPLLAWQRYAFGCIVMWFFLGPVWGLVTAWRRAH